MMSEIKSVNDSLSAGAAASARKASDSAKKASDSEKKTDDAKENKGTKTPGPVQKSNNAGGSRGAESITMDGVDFSDETKDTLKSNVSSGNGAKAGYKSESSDSFKKRFLSNLKDSPWFESPSVLPNLGKPISGDLEHLRESVTEKFQEVRDKFKSRFDKIEELLKGTREAKEDSKGPFDPDSDQERIFRETHKQMEKLGGQDFSTEDLKNSDGSITTKEYATYTNRGEDGKEMNFDESHSTTNKDGTVDKSDSFTTRNTDGSYTKTYKRDDTKGNHYYTKLKTNRDGSSNRDSVTFLNDGTEIESKETTKSDGTRVISSNEHRPDGTVTHSEKRIEKEKVEGKLGQEEREGKVEGKAGQEKTRSREEPPKIDESKLAERDKKIIDKLNLDKLEPGQKITISGEEFIKLGIGKKGGADLAAKLGRGGEITFERDRDNPDHFKLSLGMEALLGVEGSIGGNGKSAELEALGGLKGSMTLDLDMSKKGEASSSLDFLTRLAVGTTKLGPAVEALDLLGNQLNIGDIPGDVAPFIKEHFESAELEESLRCKFEASAKLFEMMGLHEEAKDKLSMGGKLERLKDPETGKTSWSLTTSLSGSGSLDFNAALGADAAEIKTKLLGEEAKLSLEQVFTFDENGKPQGSDVIFNMSFGGEVHKIPDLSSKGVTTTKGAELELSISLKDVMKALPEDVGPRLQQAIDRADYKEAGDILQNALTEESGLKIKGRFSTYERTNLNAEGELSLGVGLKGEANYENINPGQSYDGYAVITGEGVELVGDHYQDGVKQKDSGKPLFVSWDSLKEKARI